MQKEAGKKIWTTCAQAEKESNEILALPEITALCLVPEEYFEAEPNPLEMQIPHGNCSHPTL